MRIKYRSLRRRLSIILLSLTCLAWLFSIAVTTLSASQTVNNQINRLLNHYADLAEHTFRSTQSSPETRNYFGELARQISAEPGLTRLKGFGSEGKDQATNLWFGRNQYLIGETSPQFPFPVKEGMVTRRMDSELWRIIYRFLPDYRVWLAVGVNLDNVQEMGVLNWWRVILPLVLLLPLFLVVLLWGINRGLRPLQLLADKIASRRPDTLDTIEEGDEVPRELQPVVQSLNDLLIRLRRALASEKRFTSNAAHELQTPLAAIQAEVQGLQRQFSDPATRDVFSRISVRVNRATETLTQLLTLARLDPDQDFDREDVDLNNLLLEEIADLGNLAIKRGIEFEFGGFTSHVTVRGNPEWLRILLKNLLLNALKHSSADSKVEVIITSDESGVSLTIANDCKPIPLSEFDHLADRFYRGADNGEQGVGLGLSIVQRIAELHDAQLQLCPWQYQRGVIVSVFFKADTRAPV